MLLHIAVKLQLAVANSSVLAGPEDFTRGPNWDGIAFVSGPVKWGVGLITAAIVVVAGVLALVRLFGLAKANNQHAAKDAGMGIALAALAGILALMFSDLWVGLMKSVAV